MILLEPRSYHQVSGDIVVASPRRFHSVERYRFKQPDTLRYFPRQRPWERCLMDLAGRQGCVLFWLPGPAGPLDGMVYGAWYLAGQRIDGPKYLAIGRSTYYIAFLQRLAVELGAPVYQSDFMEWIDPSHPEISLMYYLETAERIDVNLEGVSPVDVRAATVEAGRCAVDGARVPKERICED